MYSVSIGLYGSSASAISAGARAGFTVSASSFDRTFVPFSVNAMLYVPAAFTVSVPLPLSAPFTSQTISSAFSGYSPPY